LPRELKLLDYLARRPGRIVTRSMLLQDVWGYTFEPNSNVVDVHIGRLRRKVDAEGEPQLIRNVRGQGYILDLPH
jgi:two-component system, OmpR family, response regulator